jgi:putative phosphoribosyl transferase
VVSRGGRPDLAGEAALAQVAAPTLLIVGEMDGVVIELNSAALNVMRCKREIVIVPGAGHLFEEPGTLDHVMTLAKDWFVRHVGGQHLGGKSSRFGPTALQTAARPGDYWRGRSRP